MPANILVVDDQLANRFLLRSVLQKDYYNVIEARDGQEAIDIALENPPDIILLDLEMPKLNGYEACEILKSDPLTHHIPIIIITANNSQEERNKGLLAGADDFLAKPIDTRILIARVRNLLRVKTLLAELQLRNKAVHGLDASPNCTLHLEPIGATKILLVTKTEKTAREVKTFLSNEGDNSVTISHDEDAAHQLAIDHEFDAMIIYENLANDGIGLRLIGRIRSDWNNRNRVIIFASQQGNETALKSLELGASDYLLIPFDDQELHVRLRTQLKKTQYANKLRGEVENQMRLSVIDPLTDLHNRRYFDLYFPRIIERAKKTGRPFALMTIDLDKFKSINDTYGHEFGDTVLVETAIRLRDTLRASDLIARFGGEEFVIVTPEVSDEVAHQISERLRKNIYETPFKTRDGKLVKVSASIGVSYVDTDNFNIADIIRASDQALYAAKRNGRNQVIFAA